MRWCFVWVVLCVCDIDDFASLLVHIFYSYHELFVLLVRVSLCRFCFHAVFRLVFVAAAHVARVLPSLELGFLLLFIFVCYSLSFVVYMSDIFRYISFSFCLDCFLFLFYVFFVVIGWFLAGFILRFIYFCYFCFSDTTSPYL